MGGSLPWATWPGADLEEGKRLPLPDQWLGQQPPLSKELWLCWERRGWVGSQCRDAGFGRGMSSRVAAAGPCLPPVLAANMRRSHVSFSSWDQIISWFLQNWFSCWENLVFHFVLTFLSVPWLSVQFSWNWVLSSSSGHRISDQHFFMKQKWKLS